MMIEELGRLEVDAARLFAEHPPRLHHPKKKRLFELAGGGARVPRWTLVVTRWAPRSTSATLGPTLGLVDAAGMYRYDEPPDGTFAWHVNFADTELFAFYGGPAFAQDEIQVAEHPVLASVRGRLLAAEAEGRGQRALTHEAGRPTPVLVRGAERWCAIDTEPALASPFGIYGRALQRASDEALAQAVTRLEDARPSNVVAMVAPRGQGRYTRAQIEEVLVTARTAFAAARAETPAGLRASISTGHWGTGAFGGNRVLMAAAQVAAARLTGVRLVYHSLDEDAAAAFRAGAAIVEPLADGTPETDVVDVLEARGFRWGESDGN